jgi:hypothetical protein
MMTKTLTSYAAVAALTFLSGCASDPIATTTDPAFKITQAQLDAAKMVPSGQNLGITGDPFNAFGADTSTTLHKIRDLFCNTENSAPVQIGSVWVRRAYKYNAGVKGVLINDVVMVKRETGYYPDGGDYEYMNIPYDSTVDYIAHPNGILPAVSDTTHRGTGAKLQTCVTCHALASAGSDRLYSR